MTPLDSVHHLSLSPPADPGRARTGQVPGRGPASDEPAMDDPDGDAPAGRNADWQAAFASAVTAW